MQKFNMTCWLLITRSTVTMMLVKLRCWCRTIIDRHAVTMHVAHYTWDQLTFDVTWVNRMVQPIRTIAGQSTVTRRVQMTAREMGGATGGDDGNLGDVY